MSLLGDIVRAEQMGIQNFTRAAGDLRNFMERERIRDLGQKFMTENPSTPEALREFAMRHKADLTTMATLVKLMKTFQSEQQWGPLTQYGGQGGPYIQKGPQGQWKHVFTPAKDTTPAANVYLWDKAKEVQLGPFTPAEAKRREMLDPENLMTYEERTAVPEVEEEDRDTYLFDTTAKKTVGPFTAMEAQRMKMDAPTRYSTYKERNAFGETAAKKKETATRVTTLSGMDPNKAYKLGYRMNEDGTVFTDPFTGAPERLPPFHEVMGKRGQIKEAKLAGELWDDAKQIWELLQDEDVRKDMVDLEAEAGRVGIGNLWGILQSKASQKIRKWMQERGISGDSKTGQLIARIQRFASEERKKYLGTAVTEQELKTILAWMPDAGASLGDIINKTRLAMNEGEEIFRRWLDIYKDVANMNPFYEAFGLKRFATSREIMSDTEGIGKQALPTGHSPGQIKKDLERDFGVTVY
jgi:hypothetical protein